MGAYSYDGRKYTNSKTRENYWVNSLADAENDILEMQKDFCDFRIILLHWGREYKVQPTEAQKNLAKKLIDNGANLIIGGHSHIFGYYEKYKNSWIFYSMGNFSFDQEWGRDGCEPSMDCIFDEKLQKKTVPTYLGTA